MNKWTSGYVTGIDYTAGFYGDMTPAHLSFALLAQDCDAPDIEGEFNYCELGCGQGLTSNLMAAAYPNGSFWSNDFSPTHIAAARRFASAAGSKNVQFFDSSFAEFCEADLPQFDFMCLHGVWTWISEENRRAILRLIRSRLKVGGVVYVSYNALPGWAPLQPLQRLLVDHAATSTEPIDARIQRAVAFAERVRNAGARYFEANQTVSARMENIKASSPNYLAHEYFVGDFAPAYHADVVRDFSEAKLSFVGSADIRHQVDALNFDPQQLELLAQIGEPVLRETVRDFIVARRFREDIFIRGLAPLDAQDAKARWLDAHFVLKMKRTDVPSVIRGPVGEVTLHPEVYEPILDALASGPKSVAQLASEPPVGAIGLDRLRQALTVLVGMEAVAPCLGTGTDTGRIARTRAFNAVSLERAQRMGSSAWLASPVTGSGVAIAGVLQSFLHARHLKREDIAEYVWELLCARGVRVKKDDRELESPEENLAELQKNVARFNAETLPVFQNLGIA
jgi:predicted O-methyltransferase YrrM